MMLQRKQNIGVLNGSWGEEIAVSYLRHKGYEIIDRNSRPLECDRRLEIDIIAWDSTTDTIVFVEVKQHAVLSKYARRLQSIDRYKCNNLRRACRAWRRVMKWRGAYRFDVIEIYGIPGRGLPIVDHVLNVRLFASAERFVKWY